MYYEQNKEITTALVGILTKNPLHGTIGIYTNTWTHSKRPYIGKANGQYAWSKEWSQYAGDMLMLAKGQSFIKITPRYPKCYGKTQMGSPYVKPGHLQGIRH